MKRQAYANSTIMLSESLVRVSVIRYLLNHGDTTAATRQVKQDIAQGFLWMSKLSRLLTTYEKQRNAYPTMESFMPRIVEFFQQRPIRSTGGPVSSRSKSSKTATIRSIPI